MANKSGSGKKRKRPAKFDSGAEVRGIARERVGTVKPARVIVPKAQRQPKYKKVEEVES